MTTPADAAERLRKKRLSSWNAKTVEQIKADLSATGREFVGDPYRRRSVMNGHAYVHWRCKYQCACGKVVEVDIQPVLNGRSKACASCSVRRAGAGNKTHGLSKTPIYTTWCSMWKRCTNEKRADYDNYGGRGITVCDEWKSFETFLADMGVPEEGLTIERIDVNGNYCKANCRWATMAEQSLNKRDTKYLTARGETKPMASWARSVGIPDSVIHARLKAGWSVERAIFRPMRRDKRRKAIQ